MRTLEYNPHHRGTAKLHVDRGSSSERLTRIILHLREDVLRSNPSLHLPSERQIQWSVRHCYQARFDFLQWEEATFELLQIMARQVPNDGPYSTTFAKAALNQLRRATRNSFLWVS